MLLRIRYSCNCGREYYVLHYYSTDTVKNRLMEIEQKCNCCGKIMKKEGGFFVGTGLEVVEENINFLGNPFVTVSDEGIRVNILNLLRQGYSGPLTVDFSRKTSTFMMDPVEGIIKKVK